MKRLVCIGKDGSRVTIPASSVKSARWTPEGVCIDTPHATIHCVRVEEYVEATVDSIPDSVLLHRAVRNARSYQFPKRYKHARWIAVMDNFGLGSTYAHQLCRRYDLDPDEEVFR